MNRGRERSFTIENEETEEKKKDQDELGVLSIDIQEEVGERVEKVHGALVKRKKGKRKTTDRPECYLMAEKKKE